MPFPTSRDFELEKKNSWYEILCDTLGGYFFNVPVSEATKKDLSDKLDFCSLRITPNSVYASAIMLIIIGILASSILFAFKFAMYGLLIISAFIGFSFYVLYYPSIITRYYRIKASSELVLSVLYMTVSLRLIPNLETAISFAADNLKSPIGKDLKKLVWNMSTGRLSANELLDVFAKKWKQENFEFYQAIEMIKTSQLEVGEKRERMLDESIRVLLRGNMERMKNYTTQLKSSLTIITMLGVTLPILTIILFPILTIFMTDAVKPIMLVIFYNIILPLIVYYIMNDVLLSMPLQFKVIDISLHPDAHKAGYFPIKINNKRIKLPLLPLAILIGALIVFIGYFIVSLPTSEAVTMSKLGGGLIILWGISSAFIFYSFFSFYRNLEIRDEIKEIETSFDDAVFQLAHILSTGQPVEKSLEKLVNSMGEMKIVNLFKNVLSNIRRFGYTMKTALFDEKVGALRYYPSHLIRSMMKIIVDSLEKGVVGSAKTMLAISQYLKSVHLVEEHMKESLDETTSEMKFTLSMLAPISCGIVVGMATIMVLVLFQITKMLVTVTGLSSAVPSLATPGMLESLVDIKKIVPAETFLVIVGTYMIEVIILLSIFLTRLEHGGDPLDGYKLLTSGLMVGMAIFSFSILLIYFIFSGILGMVWPG
jgi:hypothetical protein